MTGAAVVINPGRAMRRAFGLPTGPPEVALHVYRGDSFAARIRLWADAALTEPWDLHGAELAAQVRATPDAARATDMTVDVELPNAVLIRMDPDTARGCPPGRWDLRATWPDGRVATLVAGPVTVLADVTRD